MRDDWLDILGQIAKGAACHTDFMALHPVRVALERVDLAIMRQHPERLRQPPLREGVGRIALVIDRKRALEPFVHEVRVEHRHLLGQHHALIDDAAAAQACHVESHDPGRLHRLFDTAADDIKLPLKGFLVQPLGIGNQDLLDLGAGCVGLLAQTGNIHRHMPPAIDRMAHAQHFGFHDGPALLLRAEIGARQEHLSHGNQPVLVRLMPGAANLIVKERHRNLQVNTRPVTGLAIGIDSAPVPDRLERVDPRLDHFAAWLAVNRHHQTDAARGMFLFFGIHPVLSHPSALGCLACRPIAIEV